MKTITISEFFKSFREKQFDCPSYRMGQHFINLFVKEEYSDEVFLGLWDEKDEYVVIQRITEIIDKYQWGWNTLVIKEGREDMV